MRTEVEAKLSAPEGFALPEVPGFVASPPQATTLRARYWDTDALHLLSWGITLRYRASDNGREHGWTVKSAGSEASSEAVATHRIELEIAGDESVVPPLVDALVRPLTGGAALGPIADLTTCRAATELRDPAGNAVEVTIDDVDAAVGGVPVPMEREVEVELLDGEERAVDAVVARLLEAGLQRSSSPSKLASAITSARSIPPHPLGIPSVGPSATTVDVARAAVGRATQRLVLCAMGVQTGDDPEDIHQARVATRRLRSDLKTLEPLLEERPVEAVRGELRWLAGLLGAVRDLDVLEHSLPDAIRRVGGDAEAGSRLFDTVRHQRDERLAEVRDGLGSDRYGALIACLVELAQRPPLVAGVDPLAPARETTVPLAAKQWKRLRAKHRRLASHPPDAALHDLRRAAKRARYAYELIEPITGRRRDRRRARRLADLQGVLGALQDSVAAGEWLLRDVTQHTRGDVAFLAGRLAEHHERRRRRAHKRWPRAWRRLR